MQAAAPQVKHCDACQPRFSRLGRCEAAGHGSGWRSRSRCWCADRPGHRPSCCPWAACCCLNTETRTPSARNSRSRMVIWTFMRSLGASAGVYQSVMITPPNGSAETSGMKLMVSSEARHRKAFTATPVPRSVPACWPSCRIGRPARTGCPLPDCGRPGRWWRRACCGRPRGPTAFPSPHPGSPQAARAEDRSGPAAAVANGICEKA